MTWHLLSRDPDSIPEKAKVGFSWREFGYIAAEQYCRLNKRQEDDGIGARGDMEIAFAMWHWDEGIAGKGFQAGWDTYMIEYQRGAIYRYYKQGEENTGDTDRSDQSAF